jgi:hypothetical protein
MTMLMHALLASVLTIGLLLCMHGVDIWWKRRHPQ